MAFRDYSKKLVCSDLPLKKGDFVVVRVDWSVPVENGKITDDLRIVKTIKTFDSIISKGAKAIVLSHFDRVSKLEHIQSGSKSLKVSFERAKKLMPNYRFMFIDSTCFDTIRSEIKSNCDNFDVFVLQNTRYYDVDKNGEKVNLESKSSEELSKFYASLGDYFVNDSYGTAHRKNASNYGALTLFKSGTSAFGLLMKEEVDNITKVSQFNSDDQVFIFGGAKVSDKLASLNNIVPDAKCVIIGGAMAYTFLAAQGKEVGKSLIEESMIGSCRDILSKYGDKILLPIDHLVASEFKDVPAIVKSADDKDWGNYMALDIGPKTIEKFVCALSNKKSVVWNGPMGVYEFSNYASGTSKIFDKLVDLTKNSCCFTFIGGGDTAAAAKHFGVESQLSWISTGGGATLSFLEGALMPALDSVSDR